MKLECVFGMEQVWMVQTEQQYICIHQCLLTVLEGKENEIPTPREIHSNDGYDGEGLFTLQRKVVVAI
jgi:hypothetical protein